MKLVIKIVLVFLLMVYFSKAQSSGVSNVATTSAAFLEIGAGSRAIAMGGAFVATANDASAMYWNAAGISQIKQIETIFNHTNWLAGISYDYVGLVFPVMDEAALGINLIALTTDDMKVRTVDFPDGTGEFFDATSFAMGIAYGIHVTNRFSIGLNVKYITERIWKEKSSSFAVDIGTLYKTPVIGLRVGAAISNFGSDMQMIGDDLLVYHDIDESQDGNNDRIFAEMKTDSWPLPLIFQFGVAYDLLDDDLHKLTIETDAVHPVNNKESIHAGVEYSINSTYFIRAGYRNLFIPESEESLTLGAGVIFNIEDQFKILLDYSYADFGRLEDAQRFSLSLKF